MDDNIDTREGFTFVHTADLHLDSPFQGLYDVNPKLQEVMIKATFDAYDNIVNLCIDKKADLLLIAGDIYDSSDRSLYAQIRFLKGLNRLFEADIPVYIVHGNHDPLESWTTSLDWPENVTIFAADETFTAEFEKEGQVLARISGRSFQTAHIRDNLAKNFPEKHSDDPFTIGLLHCTVGGGEGHDPYAPCRLEDLLEKNYDYWALGHIHKPMVLTHDPPVIYPGNPQGRHCAEAGERGCQLVEVDADGEVEHSFIPMDTIRWYVEELDISGIESQEMLIETLEMKMDELLEKADSRHVICRIILTGRSWLHFTDMDILEDILLHLRDSCNLKGTFIWVERIIDMTRLPLDRRKLAGRQDLITDMISITDDLTTQSIKQTCKDLFYKGKGKKFLDPPDEEEIMSLIREAEELLLDHLISEEDYEDN